MATPEGGRGRAGKRLLVVAGLTVLAGVGFMAVRGFTGSSGGASSPEAAVERLVAAVNREDPAAAITVLAPDEVRTFGDLYEVVEEKLGDAGLVDRSQATAGVDIAITDLELGVEQLSDDVAKVTIEEVEVTWTLQPADMADPVQALNMERRSARFDRDDLVIEDERWDSREDRERRVVVEPFLMTVKGGGGWYVSPVYTAAEYWVEWADLPGGRFDARAPEGITSHDEPADAVTDLIDTLGDLDVRDTLAALPTGEWGFLWVYRDAVDEMIDDVTRSGEGFALSVDRDELVVSDGPGDYQRVSIERLSGTLETTDEYGYREVHDWSIRGWCLQWSGPDQSNEACADDGDRVWTDLFDSLEINDPFVLVEQDRGGWVVSPMATVLEYGRIMVDSATVEHLHKVIGPELLAPPDGVIEVGEVVGGELNHAGFAVYEVGLDLGERVVVPRLDEVRATLFGPDRERARNIEWGGAAPEEPGTYRVILQGEPNGPFEFVLLGVPVDDLEENRAVGRLTADVPKAAYRFQVADSGWWRVTSEIEYDGWSGESEAYAEVYADNESLGCTWSACELKAGVVYTLLVSGDGQVDFAFRLDLGAGSMIDGGSEVFGSLDGQGYGSSYRLHSVEVPAGTAARIHVDYYGDTLYYFCSTPGACTGSPGSLSWIDVTGPFSGDLELYAYGNVTYDLTISDR